VIAGHGMPSSVGVVAVHGSTLTAVVYALSVLPGAVCLARMERRFPSFGAIPRHTVRAPCTLWMVPRGTGL